jgi:hypothetical protein
MFPPSEIKVFAVVNLVGDYLVHIEDFLGVHESVLDYFQVI